MNNGFEMGDVTLFLNGEAIGTTSSLEMTIGTTGDKIVKEKDRNPMFATRELTGTFENVAFSESFKDLFLNSTRKYTAIVESYNLPRGNRLPKKKRIRNKWMKKYYEKHTFKNVEFTD